MQNYSLYWIRSPWHKCIFSEGYIGITTDFNRRLNEHARNKRITTFTKMISRYGWVNLLKDVIVSDLTESQALVLEEMLRPSPFIGWNTLKGAKVNYIRK
jgi:predicted GIY-YIG superfamily endonuclease